jgi:hypothetical protein
MFTVVDHDHAVDDDRRDAGGILMGIVIGSPIGDGLRVENRDVCVVSLAEQASID